MIQWAGCDRWSLDAKGIRRKDTAAGQRGRTRSLSVGGPVRSDGKKREGMLKGDKKNRRSVAHRQTSTFPVRSFKLVGAEQETVEAERI